MANPTVITDLFKFLSVRTPKKFQIERDDISHVSDSRMRRTIFFLNPFPEDEVGQMLQKRILGVLAGYRADAKTFDEIRNDNNSLLDSAAADLTNGLTENGFSKKEFINDLLIVIEKHLKSFNKKLLIVQVQDVIQTHFTKIPLAEFVNSGYPSIFNLLLSELFNKLYILYLYKRRFPYNLEYTLTGIRVLNVLYWLDHDTRSGLSSAMGCVPTFQKFFEKQPNTVNGLINSREDLAVASGASVLISPAFSAMCFYDSPFNSIKPIGVGDLKIVKEKLCRYEPGEVAHIENVLKGEGKERIHRRLDRLEDIFTTETEQIQENTRDTQTTDRFEVKKELENTKNDEMQTNINASGSLSGSYGVVKYNVAASAGFSYGKSSTDAARSSNNYIKEIVDKSVSRVQTKVSESRTIKKLNEVEETNRHSINNEKNSYNISGIYRYVDKRYKSQLYNYGKRMMFEFIIPEPAFFFKSVFEKIKMKPDELGVKPVAPDFPVLAINSINQATVDTWSAAFNLTNLKPEPDAEIKINQALTNISLPDKSSFQQAIQIKEDYYATSGSAFGSYITSGNFLTFFSVNIGNDKHSTIMQTSTATPIDYGQNFTGFGYIDTQLMASVLTFNIATYAINISITCQLKASAKRAWQIDVYDKIMDAYDNKLKDYQSRLSEYNNRKESIEAKGSGVEIKGQNPFFNQEIIKSEFKKHCITLLTKDYDTDPDADFASLAKPIGDRTIQLTSSTTAAIPAINLIQAKKIAPFVQFIEQAFDWNNLTYLLYSYLWHTENKWVDTFKTYEETDPLFGAFLRAGSARVLLPVLPVYETSVLHFLYTKEVWNGGEAPALDDDLYIPIHEEIRNQQDDLNNAVPELDENGKPITWEYVIPTPLVYLQDDSTLPIYNCNS